MNNRRRHDVAGTLAARIAQARAEQQAESLRRVGEAEEPSRSAARASRRDATGAVQGAEVVGAVQGGEAGAGALGPGQDAAAAGAVQGSDATGDVQGAAPGAVQGAEAAETDKKTKSALAVRLAKSRRPRLLPTTLDTDGESATGADAARNSVIRHRLALIAGAPDAEAAASAAPEDGADAAAVAAARAEIEELRAHLERVQAEVVSVRRHSERDKAEMQRFAKSGTIEQFIPIADNLEWALAQVPASLREDPWVAGVLMIGESVQAMLEREGVERINPHHAPFDPHEHEAVSCLEGADVPEGVADNTVVNVYRPGYMLNGRVLRPAQVQVALRKG